MKFSHHPHRPMPPTGWRGIAICCRSALLACAALALIGCGDFRLIRMASESTDPGEVVWYASSDNRLAPRTTDIIADASGSRGTSSDGDSTAVFLDTHAGTDLVLLIDNANHTEERFGLKQLTYARVKDGKVVRLSQPQMEPAPDPEFEKALYLAALRAREQGSSVIPYDDPRGAVTLRGTSRGNCHIQVTVLDGGDYGGQQLFSVHHNICQERQLPGAVSSD